MAAASKIALRSRSSANSKALRVEDEIFADSDEPSVCSSHCVKGQDGAEDASPVGSIKRPVVCAATC